MASQLFVATGLAGKLATSPDGVSWTQRTSGFGTDDVYGAGWSPELGLFVAVGGDGKLVTSPDGITWTLRSTGVATPLRAVVWSPELGLFVVGGDSGRLLTSPDGVTWTARNSGFVTSAVFAVEWSPELGLFVVGGASGKLATSPDGVTWTLRTSGFGSSTINGAGWSPELGLFVAVGAGGVLTASDDGVNWAVETSSFGTSFIQAVEWSPELGLFVAVGGNGKLATSPDGTTWTQRSSSFGGSTFITAVDWSPYLDLFVAAGAGGELATSPDGTSWTQRTSSFGATQISSVAWSDLLNTAPNAPNLTFPTAGVTVNRQQAQDLTWEFSDPNAGDSQSRFRVRIFTTGASTPVVDVTQDTPNVFYRLPAGTLNAGGHEWDVQTWDAQGLPGPVSSREPFTASDPPNAPTIVDPANNETISTETREIHWSTPDQDDGYQLRVYADDAGVPGVLLFDTGLVPSSGARSRIVSYPDNNTVRHTLVRIMDGGLWSEDAAVANPVSYTVPETPTAAVAVYQLSVGGQLRDAAYAISASHPTPGVDVPTVTSMEVWRRKKRYDAAGNFLGYDETEGGEQGWRVGFGIAPSATFLDYAVALGGHYDFRVKDLGDNGTSVYSDWAAA